MLEIFHSSFILYSQYLPLVYQNNFIAKVRAWDVAQVEELVMEVFLLQYINLEIFVNIFFTKYLESLDHTKDICHHISGGELHVVRENAGPVESEGGGDLQQGRIMNNIHHFFEEPNCRAQLKIHWTSQVFLRSKQHL